MFETLMENNVVKVYGQVPEKIKNALVNEFGFHVSYSVTKNMTILLAFLVWKQRDRSSCVAFKELD